MDHWLEAIPALRVLPKRIDADDYNRIKLGLLREQTPWRIGLKQLRCLDCILDETAWVCVDECHNDQPILAWTHFEHARRDSLRDDVGCELRLYHTHAGLIMGHAIEALSAAIDEHLKQNKAGATPVSKLTL